MNLPLPAAEFNPGQLSVREREILDLAVDGRTDEQIANAMDISVSTVNSSGCTSGSSSGSSAASNSSRR